MRVSARTALVKIQSRQPTREQSLSTSGYSSVTSRLRFDSLETISRAPSASQTVSLQSHNARIQVGGQVLEEVATGVEVVTRAARIDMKLEALAKQFYANLGWRLDADFPFDNGFRVVQFTPPGSGCSVQFGTNITSAVPGSAQGLYLIVSDIEAARGELVARGLNISEVFHAGTPGGQFQPDGTSGRLSGPAPEHVSYGSYATFSDPDGNKWLLQEVTTRLAGRIDSGETSFASANDLASALRRAEAAHGEHEKRTGQRDENWPEWYATYMVAEQAGKELPQ